MFISQVMWVICGGSRMPLTGSAHVAALVTAAVAALATPAVAADKDNDSSRLIICGWEHSLRENVRHKHTNKIPSVPIPHYTVHLHNLFSHRLAHRPALMSACRSVSPLSRSSVSVVTECVFLITSGKRKRDLHLDRSFAPL